ncbi:MAG: helix-turn-helix domain-containing protein [Thermoplasmatota archaeon]
MLYELETQLASGTPVSAFSPAVARVARERPRLEIELSDCRVSFDTLACLVRARGPPEDLLALASAVRETTPGRISYDEAEPTAGAFAWSEMWKRAPVAERLLPWRAARHLRGGAIVTARLAGGAETVHVTHADRVGLSGLLVEMRRDVAAGGDLLVARVGPYRPPGASSNELRPNEREMLALAVRRGYYDWPRRTTLRQLATELGVPPTTLAYRLRRASRIALTRFAGAEAVVAKA